MFENFCSDITQTMKCFALESFKLSSRIYQNKRYITADYILI